MLSTTSPKPSPALLLSLGAAGLMVCLPFLVSWQTAPITTFRAEWIAAALGLIACVALLGSPSLAIPGVTWLAVALAGWIAVGDAIRGSQVPQVSELYLLYLSWAAMLACVGRRLALEFGSMTLARTLASAFLAGSLLACSAGMLWPWMNALGWPVFPIPLGGPVGQVNHLVAYGWMGLASALFLRLRGWLPTAGFWLAVSLLTLAMGLAGQRSSFLYVGVLLAAAVIGTDARGSNKQRQVRLAGAIALLLIVVQAALPLLPREESTGPIKPSPLLRTWEMASGPSVRLQLWRVGLEGLRDAPLLGKGAGSYPSQSLEYAHRISSIDNPGPSANPHNLLVHLGCELGLPALLLTLWAALSWFRKQNREREGTFPWAASIVGIAVVHSMVEYPLWHTYFLGPVALLVGAFGGGGALRASRFLLAFAAAVTIALGATILAGLWRDYDHLESAFSEDGTQALENARRSLLAVSSTSLLAPWVSTTACASLNPVSVDPADGLAVCNAAMRFAPTREVGVHEVILLWRSGHPAAARDLLDRLRLATSAYGPGDIDKMLGKWILVNPGLSLLWEED